MSDPFCKNVTPLFHFGMPQVVRMQDYLELLDAAVLVANPQGSATSVLAAKDDINRHAHNMRETMRMNKASKLTT